MKEENKLIEVDFGLGKNKPIALINFETKEIIEEFNDALQALMWLAVSQDIYTLKNRTVDYGNDEDFDKWLEESSVGGVEQEQFKLGQEIFKRGGSYKSCKNKHTLNGYTHEERLSSCGYAYESWNKDGQGQFGIRQKTIRNNMDKDVKLAFREE